MADSRIDHEKRIAAIKAALRRISLKTDAQMGRVGEKFAKVGAEKTRIPSLTRTAKYRVPDMLSDTHLVEVKNVKYQRVTNQLRDFLKFCHQSNRHFILCLRDDATLSYEVKELVRNGEIEVRPLGYIFTKAGREKLFKAIEPIVSKALRGIAGEADDAPHPRASVDD